MTRYFKICLWSPLWLPAILTALYFAGDAIWPRFDTLLPGWVIGVGFVLLMSLVFGGAQYVVTLILVWPRINFFDFASWRKWVLRLPLIFVPIQFGGLLLFAMGDFDGWYRFADYLPIAAISLILGYLYVATWLLGHWAIQAVRRSTAHDDKGTLGKTA